MQYFPERFRYSEFCQLCKFILRKFSEKTVGRKTDFSIRIVCPTAIIHQQSFIIFKYVINKLRHAVVVIGRHN